MISLLDKKFKVSEITPLKVDKINDKELLNMHRRIHGLYAKQKREDWKQTHNLIVSVMKKRGMQHNSPLQESEIILESETTDFSIQLHIANKAGRHFDLRIKKDGVLKSWTSRKIDDFISGKEDKIKLIKMPDHSLNYIHFKGTIKSGYGAGTVELWDSGKATIRKWTPESKVLTFNGKKLKGNFAIIKTKDNDYIFIKMKEK